MSFSYDLTAKETWYEFVSSDNLPPIQFYGYDRQFRVCTLMVLDSVDKNLKSRPKSLLIFGFPGNGKTLFPKALLKHLKETHNREFYLMRIICDNIPIEYYEAEQITKELDKIIDTSLEKQPTIICFDEVDLLCPPIGKVPPKKTSYSTWMRRLLKHTKIKTQDVFFIGVTNYPSYMDDSVKRNFDTCLYFEPTPNDVIKKIIEAKLGEEMSKKGIPDKYIKEFQDSSPGLKPMGAHAIKACIISKEAHENLNELAIEDVVTILKANTPLASTTIAIEAFEEANAALIAHSEKHVVPYWLTLRK